MNNITKIGFTGTSSGMNEIQKIGVSELLITYQPKIVYHGMCIGADEDFHNLVRELLPNCKIIGLPGKFASGKENDKKSNITVDELREEDTHFSRNRKIVNSTELLIACPYSDEEVGGTWYTINYALKNKRKVEIIKR